MQPIVSLPIRVHSARPYPVYPLQMPNLQLETSCAIIHGVVMREWLSGRAAPCQGAGRGFDPRLPLQCYLRATQRESGTFLAAFRAQGRSVIKTDQTQKPGALATKWRLAFALAVDRCYRITVISNDSPGYAPSSAADESSPPTWTPRRPAHCQAVNGAMDWNSHHTPPDHVKQLTDLPDRE
jgi:hypothetical protein